MSVSAKPQAELSALTAAAVFQAGDFPGSGAIIAAISGGGDSLALLFLLHDFLQAQGLEKRLVAITIDHDLREESAAEAAEVAKLCGKFGIKHETLRWEGEKPKLHLQAAARAARYKLLAQAAETYQAAVICTAHTLDDQTETYFMRKARLADTAKAGEFAVVTQRGLACMARVSLLYGQFRLLRPLLTVRRADLRAFLNSRKISWRDDPSNENRRYERVRIRQDLTEAEKKQGGAAVCAAAAARQALSAAAARWGEKLKLRRADDALRLDLSALHDGQIILAKADFAALYLLLAAAAALCGGKTFIAADNARLKQFALKLPQRQKGEKPLRISVSGAVLQKRQGILSIEREKRAVPNGQAAPRAAAFSQAGPFAFIIPAWDAPLFLLFAPFLAKSAAEKCGNPAENSGIFAGFSWQGDKGRLC